jgi:hypothetical protein
VSLKKSQKAEKADKAPERKSGMNLQAMMVGLFVLSFTAIYSF